MSSTTEVTTWDCPKCHGNMALDESVCHHCGYEPVLHIWHIPQVPMKAFRYQVKTPIEGMRLLNVLADYDLFEFENRVKPDYSNAQGLAVYIPFEDEEWEWETTEGDQASDLARNGILKNVY